MKILLFFTNEAVCINKHVNSKNQISAEKEKNMNFSFVSKMQRWRFHPNVFGFIFVVVIFLMMLSGNPKLSTPYGDVEGFNYITNNGKQMQIFLGVPFARAERFEVCFCSSSYIDFDFQKPKRHPLWSGVRPAKEFPKGCVPIHLSLGTDNSEDCLYINIIKPQEEVSLHWLPVLNTKYFSQRIHSDILYWCLFMEEDLSEGFQANMDTNHYLITLHRRIFSLSLFNTD